MIKKADYLKQYAGEALDEKSKTAKALETALDVRKFEIDAYWKRGTYFWTFIGAAFVALFAVPPPSKLFDNIVIVNLGFLFSLAWYLVNRGSASWQRNWEAQVDILEDEIMGPLFKSTINRRTYNLWELAGPYAFSPSRLKTILSLIMAATWLIFVCRDYLYLLEDKSGFGLLLALIDILVLFGASWALLKWGKTDQSDDKRLIEVRNREYE